MELKAYIAPLRKWWWLILASTLIAAVTSYAAVSQQALIYQARATLLIGSAINNPNPTGNDFWLSQQLAQTYIDIARRETVRDAVMERIGLTWLPEYAASAVPNTQLIELTVTDSSPERAMVIANELANELVLQTPTNRQESTSDREAFINQQLDELELSIEETGAEILARQEELAELFSARQIADTQAQIAALEDKRNTLQSNYATLLTNSTQGAANTLSVIEPATLPTVPIGPDVLMTVLTSAAIGFTLAVAAAYLLEYLDDTVKSPEDVQAAAQLATLAGIAEYKPENSAQPKLVTLAQPRSPISEAYRSLRTAILFSSVDDPVRTLLVTSPGPSEGKSFTAANLAVVMAQTGSKVLLIDADLRKPVQHRLFETNRNFGLTDLLISMSPEPDNHRPPLAHPQLNQAISETKQPGLYLITSGSVPPNPAELVGSAKMKSLIATLAKGFDFIVIDSPPSLAVTDAVILSTRVDSVLLIATAGETRRNQLGQAMMRLREVNANVAGVVLNRLTARSSDYYYYYYYQKSYYHDDSDDGSGDGSSERPEKKPKSEQSSRFPLPNFIVRYLS